MIQYYFYKNLNTEIIKIFVCEKLEITIMLTLRKDNQLYGKYSLLLVRKLMI